MSGFDCGPDDPDCSQFLGELYLLLDAECDEQRRTALDRHLRDCPPCFEAYGVERDLKLLVRRGCSGEKAPEQLRLRVREQIRQAHVVATRAVRTTSTYVGEDGSVTQVQQTSVEVRGTRRTQP